MGLKVLSSEVVQTARSQYGVVTVESESRPGVTYRVDFTNCRCSCPAWTRSRPNEQGLRPACKHLKQLAAQHS